MESLEDFFLFGGVSLFCLGSAMLYKQINFVRKSRIGMGKIVDYVKHETRRSCFHPVVEFSDSNNSKLTFKSSVASNNKRYKIGEKVSIRYVPEKPEIAEINKAWIIWFEIPLCFIFGFVLLWLAF